MIKRICRPIRTLGLVVMIFASFIWTTRGETTDYPKTPGAVLEKYVAMDSAGMSASTKAWSEFARYITWTDAAPWDQMTVIDHYQIGKVVQGTTRAQGTVTYQPLGKVSDVFTPDPQPERVLFYLKNVNNVWKVDGPQIMPHVTVDVIRKILEARTAADPKSKPANEALLNQILSAKQTLK